MTSRTTASIDIIEGKARVYNMSGRRDNTDSPWRGRQRFHSRRSQSHRQLRQFLNHKIDIFLSVARENLTCR